MRFLGEEQGRVRNGCAVHGEQLLEEAFAALRDAIRNLPDHKETESVVGRFLAAEAVCAEGSASLLTSVTAQLEAVLDEGPKALVGRQASDAVESYVFALAREVFRLRAMDRRSCDRELANRLAFRWLGMPAALRKLIETHATVRGADMYLSSLLAGCGDEAEIEGLVRLHAAQPERTIYALFFAAVRHVLAAAGWTPGDPTPDDALAPLGQNLIALRAGLLLRPSAERLPLRDDFAVGAASHVAAAPAVYEFLCRDDAPSLLLEWLVLDEARQLDEFEAQLAIELGQTAPDAKPQPAVAATG
jgi:hypothetical protein